MLRIILFFTAFVFLSVDARASFIFNSNCTQAYNEMIGLNFKKAKQILADEKKANPENLIPEYVESYIDFLTAFISEDDSSFEYLKKKRIERLDLIDKDDAGSPYFLLSKAEINLQTAFVKLKFREYLTAAYEFRKGYKLLEANEKKFPGFAPNKKCLGLLHALIGAVPSDYKWLVTILGFHGTIQQGIGELRDLLNISEKNNQYAYTHDEVMILLMYFEFHLLKNAKSATELASKIENQKPAQLHLFAISSIYFYTGENEKIIELLSKREINNDAFPLPYLDFMLGAAKLNALDFTAEKYFNSYLLNFKGKSMVRAAYQKLAWMDLLRNDSAGYNQYMTIIKEKGDDFTDEDKQALKEAESGEVPNVYLLRARLLFDGGYFDRALAEIAGKPITFFPTYRDQLELIYRLARIYDHRGQKEKAIDNYVRTINFGETKPYYFAANSALYLGLLYENDKDSVNAIKYYRKCLSMRNHEYQNSIDQKAEAGLNRLGIRN